MTIILITAALLIVFLALEAFFSGSEAAYVAASKPKLFRKAKDRDPRAVQAKNLLSQPEVLFSTSVVGTTLMINAAATLVTQVVLDRYGLNQEWITLVTLTPVILIFGEFMPKLYGRANADTLVIKLAPYVRIASIVLYPLTKLFSLYAQVLKKVLGENPSKGFFLSREEIKAALPASRGTDVTTAERQLIERILDFGKITAKEMLRPLIDVVGVEENETIRDVIKLIAESGHSRIPVYQERVDRIVGVVQSYDCLHVQDLSQPVKALMQPAFFIPESKPLDELLLELKTRPMAIAVNEFGGAEGIITMEDVMEEVVGEIEDEYDEPPKLFHKIGENSYIVNARMEVDAMREQIRIPIAYDEDYQTLAGFLLMKMQKIPKKWDSIVIDNVEYVIQSATDRSIEEVYVILHSKKD